MSIILKKDNIELIQNTNILTKLYFELYNLPSPSEIDQYNKKHKTDFNLQNLREIIADINTSIPLFDISSQNIYLIPANQVFEYINKKFYRLPNNQILTFLENAEKNTANPKLKKRLTKNINFIKNYDFDTLYNTYLRVIYENSNQIGKNITYCRRATYLPYLDISPYYTRSEIINMGLNLKLIKADLTYYDNSKLENLCTKLVENDISSEIILKHQMYIDKNNAQHIIYYYTFYGSLYYNRYLRDPDNYYDKYISKNINKLLNLIKKAPAFDKDYYVYRFVSSDKYLEDVKVNGIFKEESFISTSRNPFYEPKNHVFGNILIKIKIPKNKEGIGLCVEPYSLFPSEQEILLAPGKLKLISKDSNFKYYHPDIIAQKEIKKKYEFEYIDSINNIELKRNKEEEIRTLSDNFTLISTDSNEKNLEFYRSVPIINDMHYFRWDDYVFQIFYLDKITAYYKYYFLLESKKTDQEIIFIVLQDPDTQEINLIIEIGDKISVNYLHKFTGAKSIKDEELIKILKYLSNLFSINTVIIHPNYTRFENKINKLPKYNIDEYYEEDLIKFSADLITYNKDVWDYIFDKKVRFDGNNIILNKMNLYGLDRLKRLNPEEVLKITDVDDIYRIWKKTKITNTTDLLIYIHNEYFYLLKQLLEKINSVLKVNPFIYGYYVYLYETSFNVESVEDVFKEKTTNNTTRKREIE